MIKNSSHYVFAKVAIHKLLKSCRRIIPIALWAYDQHNDKTNIGVRNPLRLIRVGLKTDTYFAGEVRQLNGA